MSVPLKLGAATAITGAVVLMVATMLHPLGADPGDPVAAFTEYAADELWVGSHLSQFLGVFLLFVALVALNDSLKGETFAWVAKLGLLVGIAALGTTAILQAVDGIALKNMVDNWASAAEAQRPETFQAALAVRQIEIGVASFVALLFGAAFVLFGTAIVASAYYPTWLGWLGIIGGAGTVASGMLMAFTGFSTTAMNLAMPFNLILVVWMVVIGVLMWRRA
ncbi:MAG: DUF4386 family protein [Acidiferrobacterales bacterium]